jgi:hypothetical protein
VIDEIELVEADVGGGEDMMTERYKDRRIDG